MKSPPLNHALVSWILKNIDPGSKKLSLYWREYPLRSGDFENIIGIKDGGHDVDTVENDDISELKLLISGGNGRILLSNLAKQVEQSTSAYYIFILQFSLFVIGTLLCPRTGIHISSDYIKYLKDVGQIPTLNWAAHAFTFFYGFHSQLY